jgi:hypothetical protein
MKRPKVIKLNQLPARLPFIPTIAWGLLLDRFHAPGWLWGAIGVLFLVFWIIAIIAMCIQDPIKLKELSGE